MALTLDEVLDKFEKDCQDAEDFEKEKLVKDLKEIKKNIADLSKIETVALPDVTIPLTIIEEGIKLKPSLVFILVAAAIQEAVESA